MKHTLIIDEETKIMYHEDSDTVTIVQQEENWGSARPLENYAISIKNLNKLIQGLQSIQQEKYKGW